MVDKMKCDGEECSKSKRIEICKDFWKIYITVLQDGASLPKHSCWNVHVSSHVLMEMQDLGSNEIVSSSPDLHDHDIFLPVTFRGWKDISVSSPMKSELMF